MIKLAIEIPDEKLQDLRNFLERNDASQNLEARVLAASTEAAGPHLTGLHLAEAAQQVNRYLARIGAGPEIPRRGRPWNAARIQETLQLMLSNFNWLEGEIVNCGWEDRPEHWTELVALHPGVFGGTPG